MSLYGERIRVRGLVQGVGFRPTVWRLANAANLAGDVINDGDGVLIRVWGDKQKIDAFCARLVEDCPPLARIDALERGPATEPCDEPGVFRIAESQQTAIRTGVVADAATCPACREDLFDPSNRRYRYPFTNCTHCGPRLSIVRGIPYDRANTSMASFEQCPACLAEYQDPADRRFHAQPNACPACGPHVWLVDRDGQNLSAGSPMEEDPIAHAARLLAEGAILSIKGIGGFHLVCDPTSDQAVDTLRARKQRYAKPFALMADSPTTIERYATLETAAHALLKTPAAPIVLLPLRPDGRPLAAGVAPAQDTLGFMLPYSPLHHLLMADWIRLRPDTPLVMTSGNRSDEPQCTGNADAARRLGEIADFHLLHNREIVNRVDDSVVRIDRGLPRLLRRARGYAPSPLALPPGFAKAPPLLALGAELKNTFCLLNDHQAIVSQHLGDLEDARTSDAWEEALRLYRDLYRHRPKAIIVDRHPDYRSTRFGRSLAAKQGHALIEVQHHHAHIAAVMADNGRALDSPPVLGIALDGLGMGDDGTLWGGELLLVDYRHSERLAHLPPVPLPGGTRALVEPWRNTWAQLDSQLGWDSVHNHWGHLESIQWFQEKPVDVLSAMVSKKLNTPLSSAAGRLFDAVAGLLGICRERISYEGQAAIELEVLARQAPDDSSAYPIEFGTDTPSLAPFWTAALADLGQGVSTAVVAVRFHRGLANAIVEAAKRLRDRYRFDTVALSGGVFQNRLLFDLVSTGFEETELEVLSHHQVPTNDGCIAFGQALIGAALLLDN